MGHLVETGCLAQWLHFHEGMHYARWSGKGRNEVDFVLLNARLRPEFALEVKWSDSPVEQPERELKALLEFSRDNGLAFAAVTTRTIERDEVVGGMRVHFVPAALYCHVVGRNLVKDGWNVSRIFRESPSAAPAATPFE